MKTSIAARFQYCSPNCINTVATPGWCETCWPTNPWEGPAGHAHPRFKSLYAAGVPTKLTVPSILDEKRLTDHEYEKVPVRL